MRLGDLDDPFPSTDARFRLIGELARKWDKAKYYPMPFDRLVQTFQHKYGLDVSHRMIGIAFHGILVEKPMEFIQNLIDEVDKINA